MAVSADTGASWMLPVYPFHPVVKRSRRGFDKSVKLWDVDAESRTYGKCLLTLKGILTQ